METKTDIVEPVTPQEKILETKEQLKESLQVQEKVVEKDEEKEQKSNSESNKSQDNGSFILVDKEAPTKVIEPPKKVPQALSFDYKIPEEKSEDEESKIASSK